MNWLSLGILFICLSPIWGAFLWCLWEGVIQPSLIPWNKINADVDELYTRYGEEAFEHVCMKEQRACYDSDGFEQGRWRRIRLEVMQRERARGITFRKMRR